MISDSLQDHIRPITELQPDPANARKHSERNIEAIMASLARFGQVKPVVLGSNGQTVIAGNGTLEAAKRLGWTELAAVTTELAGSEATAFGIADNQTALLAEWDDDILHNLVHGLPDELQTATGFDSDEIDKMVQSATEDPAGTLPSLEVAPSLADRFLIPPFSVMNTGKAWWQDRKRQWISQGINSELGREAGLAFENVNALDPRLYEKKRRSWADP
jgi:ParB-like chromosome segregation protein Spo0J